MLIRSSLGCERFWAPGHEIGIRSSTMSVQAGILSLQNRHISPHELEFLLFGLEERSPDYSDMVISRSVGMAFRGLLLSPEDKHDQPLQSASGALLTFDGRLDR